MKPFKNAVFYQIWPRSFKDTNNDGIGDLRGIIEKLEYIKSLSVDYIWISPFYTSPQDDYGYDVSDYMSIASEYGTMADFKALVAKARTLEMGIICDLVANHTSTAHPWFKEALNNPLSEKRDYYFFKPVNKGLPNNWISVFGGSAWTQVSAQDYALTLFTPTQADLNWDNPKVRTEIKEIMKVWLDLGIAGFRLDVFNTISKIESLASKNPHLSGFQFAGDYILNRPKGQAYLKSIIGELKESYNFITIGEGMLIDQDAAKTMCGPQADQLDMIIHFDLHMLGCGPLGKFDFRKGYYYTNKDFKRVLRSWNHAAQEHHFHIASTFSNHDQPRAVSRFGNDKKYRMESAKALFAINFFNVGSPFIYQGEEIAMKNMVLAQSEWKDFEAKNTFLALQTMMKVPAFLARKIIAKMSRDHARGVMQWDNSTYAGFSQVKPWFKCNDDKDTINVAMQEQDPHSVLNYVRTLSALYHQHATLSDGRWSELFLDHPRVIAMQRTDKHSCFTLVCNFSKYSTQLAISSYGEVVLSNYHTSSPYKLFPYETRIYVSAIGK